MLTCVFILNKEVIIHLITLFPLKNSIVKNLGIPSNVLFISVSEFQEGIQNGKKDMKG